MLKGGASDFSVPSLSTVVDYNARAKQKLERGDYTAAIKDYTAALSLKPNDTGALVMRGLAKHCMENDKDALPDYDEAIRLGRNLKAAYHSRGLSRQALGDYAGAMSDYQKAIEAGDTQASPARLKEAKGLLKEWEERERKRAAEEAIQCREREAKAQEETKIKSFMRELDEMQSAFKTVFYFVRGNFYFEMASNEKVQKCKEMYLDQAAQDFQQVLNASSFVKGAAKKLEEIEKLRQGFVANALSKTGMFFKPNVAQPKPLNREELTEQRRRLGEVKGKLRGQLRS